MKIVLHQYFHHFSTKFESPNYMLTDFPGGLAV